MLVVTDYNSKNNAGCYRRKLDEIYFKPRAHIKTVCFLKLNEIFTIKIRVLRNATVMYLSQKFGIFCPRFGNFFKAKGIIIHSGL